LATFTEILCWWRRYCDWRCT